MRRILGLLVAGLFMVTLSACGGGGGGASKGAFCDAAKDAQKNEEQFGEALTSGDAKKLDAANSFIQSLASKAPSEIKADAKVVADAFKKYVDAVKSADGDPDKLQEAEEKLAPEQDKVTAAFDNIEAYSKKECGVSLNGSDSSDDSSDSSSSSSSKKSSSSSSSSKKSSSSSSDDFSFDSDLSSFLSSFSDFTDFSDFSDFSPN